MTYRAVVITCSDRAAADLYEDRSGPILREGLAQLGFEVADAVIIPDDTERIASAITEAILGGARIVVTTGGTGIAPRDVTVEATRGLLDYEVPGIMEETRRVGLAATDRSLLSRGLAGVATIGTTRAFVLNAPGSRGGARDALRVAGPLLVHIVEQLDGADHPMD